MLISLLLVASLQCSSIKCYGHAGRPHYEHLFPFRVSLKSSFPQNHGTESPVASIGSKAFRDWIQHIIDIAPDHFRAERGKEIRVETRARGAIAHYYELLAIPPGFTQEINTSSAGTYASGIVMVTKVKLSDREAEFATAGFSFSPKGDTEAQTYFTKLVAAAKATISSGWTVSKDTASEFEANKNHVTLTINRYGSDDVTIKITHNEYD